MATRFRSESMGGQEKSIEEGITLGKRSKEMLGLHTTCVALINEWYIIERHRGSTDPAGPPTGGPTRKRGKLPSDAVVL